MKKKLVDKHTKEIRKWFLYRRLNLVFLCLEAIAIAGLICLLIMNYKYFLVGLKVLIIIVLLIFVAEYISIIVEKIKKRHH